jgi:hypothetical protein
VVNMEKKQYERNIIVNATEDYLVMTTAKIPAGVCLKQLLIPPSNNGYSEYLQMFVSMDTEVEDGGYDKERILMFSLSCNLCPMDVMEFLQDSFYRVKILGDYIDGYIIGDDSTTAFNTDFCLSWV